MTQHSSDLSPFPAQVSYLEIDEGSVGQRLDNFLVKTLKGVPKTHIYRIIRSGEVRVNKARATADTRLAEGDLVRIPPVVLAQRSAHAAPIPAKEFPILFEDETILALNKPAGVAVHGGSGVSFGVIEQLRQARPEAKFLELVHRLDKETSGILLLAKKRSVLAALQDQFRKRQTIKTYAALVWGHWPDRQHVIDVALHKYLTPEGERRVRVVQGEQSGEGQRAISLVRVAARFVQHSLLDVTIKTGRTHQIRVHLAHTGHPIIGDEKYGDIERQRQWAKSVSFKRMFLHARYLQFSHPQTNQVVVLEAALPMDCQQLLAALPKSPQ